jgi:hypothetical protein
MTSALDKVLASAQVQASSVDECFPEEELARAALTAAQELLALLSKKDPDNDGDDDTSAKGDTDHDFFGKNGKRKKKVKGKGDSEEEHGDEDDKKVRAAALAEAVVIALAGLEPAEADWVEATAGQSELVALASDSKGSSKKPYGNVRYADPGYRGKARYPIDTPEHVRAAWSYINQKKNAAKYSPEELAKIKAAIKRAMKKHGIGGGDAGDKMAATLALAARQQKEQLQALHHGRFNGGHTHPHHVLAVHEHEHFHNNDSRHECGERMGMDY